MRIHSSTWYNTCHMCPCLSQARMQGMLSVPSDADRSAPLPLHAQLAQLSMRLCILLKKVGLVGGVALSMRPSTERHEGSE